MRTRNDIRDGFLRNLGGRRCWRDLTGAAVLPLAAVATAPFAPSTAAAQEEQTKVTYTVEFRTTGELLDPNCAGSGTDVLTGTLVGFEPAEAGEDTEYVGTLTRTTTITTCGLRRSAPDIDSVCSINYVGNGLADVVFTLYADGRGGYLQYIDNRRAWAALLPPPPVGAVVNSQVTGTCDRAELDELQNEYGEGQTAGSPNGQPLEVSGWPSLDRQPTFPLEFPPDPPISIWTLTLLDRRP